MTDAHSPSATLEVRAGGHALADLADLFRRCGWRVEQRDNRTIQVEIPCLDEATEVELRFVIEAWQLGFPGLEAEMLLESETLP